MSQEFDKSKDRCLWEEEAYSNEYGSLTVGIYQYGDNGKPKIQISRQKKGTFVKLGRMSCDEFSAVAKAVKRGFEDIEKADQGSEPDGWSEESPF